MVGPETPFCALLSPSLRSRLDVPDDFSVTYLDPEVCLSNYKLHCLGQREDPCFLLSERCSRHVLIWARCIGTFLVSKENFSLDSFSPCPAAHDSLNPMISMQGDWITISSDPELREAIALVQQRSIPLLEIMVTTRGKNVLHSEDSSISEQLTDGGSHRSSSADFDFVAEVDSQSSHCTDVPLADALAVLDSAVTDPFASDSNESHGSHSSQSTSYTDDPGIQMAIFKALHAVQAPPHVVDRLAEAIRCAFCKCARLL
jgi:hypothetical protein